MKFISKSSSEDKDLQKFADVQYSTLCDWLRTIDSNINRLINSNKLLINKLDDLNTLLVTDQKTLDEACGIRPDNIAE